MAEFLKVATTNLSYKDGIWYAEKTGNISYPEEGNDNCFQVEENSFWFNHRNRCIHAVVNKYIKEKIFFDIGGGNGFVSKYLQEMGINSCLIEPGSGVFNAKKRGLKYIIKSELNKNFQNNTFQNAGAFDVIEHIEDDMSFISEIYDKLKKDGLLFITVPAFNLLWSNADKNAGHFKRYTLSSINKKLKANHFTVLYSTYFFHILPIPLFIFRTLPYLLKGDKKNTAHSKGKNITKNPHKKKSKLLDKILDIELRLIKRGKRIPFGGSCLIVAKK